MEIFSKHAPAMANLKRDQNGTGDCRGRRDGTGDNFDHNGGGDSGYGCQY